MNREKGTSGLGGLLATGIGYLLRLAEQPETPRPPIGPPPPKTYSATQPYIITLSGHFSAGKDEVYRELRAQMVTQGLPVVGLINYKSRASRSREIAGVDYKHIESPTHYSELIRTGEILVPYVHDSRQYGLSKEFMDALGNKKIPLMITDEAGLVALMEYLGTQSVPNKLMSFMLHTTKNDALARLLGRAGSIPTQDELRQMKAHMGGYLDEMERYRTHEDLFRHVLKNNTVEGIPKEEQIHHLGARVLSILDLESKVNAPTAEDFRGSYVDNTVRKLFGSSTTEVVSSANQGIQLPIPDEVIKKYSREHGIDLSLVRNAARKKVLVASTHYGYFSLYLEPATTNDEKRVLTDLIEISVGLPHQYKKGEVEFTRDSHLSLQKIADQDTGLMDDLISFSSYDPMRVPRQDARTHTLVFQGLKDTKSPNIEPLPVTQAKKIIEGN